MFLINLANIHRVDSQNFSKSITEAIEIFKRGGIVSHPTDTVWGLACDASNKKAVRKIHLLKKSDPSKPLLLNLPSKSYLDKIGSKLCRAHLLVKEFWPGSLSLIVRSKSKCEFSQTQKIGVRFPDHEISNLLARKFGKPLITTSANFAGEKVAKNAKEVMKIFPKIDLILDDLSSSKNNPSTLVDVSEKEIQLIREGTLSFKQVLRTLDPL